MDLTVREQLREAAALGERDAAFLYQHWYLQLAPAPAPAGPVRPLELDVAMALRAAHAGSEQFENGWRARRVSTHGRAEVVRGDRVRLIERADYVVRHRPGLRAEPGDEVAVVAREETIDGGFWITQLGDWPQAAAGLLTRLYWRVSAEAAPELVRALTSALLAAGTPAALKAPVHVSGFTRADAVVVYLPPQAFTDLSPALAAIASRLGPALQDPPPRLTRRLAPGVGAAEGWAGEESFGQARCRLVAAALAGGGNDDPVQRIRTQFAAAGLDPDRPHLEPGSPDRYVW